MTQLMARFTTLLDSRKKVPMTGRVYLRAIVPIGAFFSLSLILSNAAYLFLSVAFIQMLKARYDASTEKTSTNLSPGYYSRRRPTYHLGPRHAAPEPPHPRKRFRHRRRRHDRIARRDQVCHDWIRLPDCWRLLRSHSSGHG